MTFKEFYISDNDGKSNCVIRSLCKILNKEYEEVYNGLCEISKELNCFHLMIYQYLKNI